MTDYERGYHQGKADATKKMHPEIRKFFEDYFDKCFKEYQEHVRPWVGLTDEEMRECAKAMDAEPLAGGWLELIKFARAVEYKLRSKNT